MRLGNIGDARRPFQPSTSERWIVLGRWEPSGEVPTVSPINLSTAKRKKITVLTYMIISSMHIREQHAVLASPRRPIAKLSKRISKITSEKVAKVAVTDPYFRSLLLTKVIGFRVDPYV